MKIERAELVRELLRIISSKPQGFKITPKNLAFIVKRDEQFNQRIEVKVLPFYADKLDDNAGEESDTDDERNMLKIDSILDNFIGNFNESKPSVDQSKERDFFYSY